jgi:hypothetical protein
MQITGRVHGDLEGSIEIESTRLADITFHYRIQPRGFYYQLVI